jgi:hypothetical protein
LEDDPIGWVWRAWKTPESPESEPDGLWYNSSRDDPLLHEIRDEAIVKLMHCWVLRQFRRMGKGTCERQVATW